MYSILIVEDELLELNALAKIVSTEMSVFDSVLTADNGETALELALQNKPDIILMDIHLGSANGLELSNMIMEECLFSKIIVVTAHDQFSYAQKALKIGVTDYLLKPVNTAVLIEAINKQIGKIEEEQASLLKKTGLQSNLKKLKENYEASTVATIINKTIEDNTTAILSTIGIQFACANMLIVDFNTRNLELNFSERTILKRIIVDTLSGEEFDSTLLFDILNTGTVVICAFHPGKISDHVNLELAKRIRRILTTELHISVKISVSETAVDIKDLPSAYDHAMLAHSVGNDSINLYTDFIDTQVDRTDNVDNSQLFVAAIINNDRAQLMSLTDQMFSNYSLCNVDSFSVQSQLIQLLIYVQNDLIGKFSAHSASFEAIIRDGIKQIISTSYTGWKAAFNEIITLLYEKADGILKAKVNHISLRAKKYIDTHFKEQITLTDIADALNISPYYLSRIYKKENLININQYLNNARIVYAKKMLASTRTSVKEIGLDSGFTDANYFCRVFRKSVGLTPTQYRQSQN